MKTVTKNSICLLQVDIIVNTISKDLILNQGAVSASIAAVGGKSIQQECRSKYPSGIDYGEIAVTGGGKLYCKLVCHAALPNCDQDKEKSKKVR